MTDVKPLSERMRKSFDIDENWFQGVESLEAELEDVRALQATTSEQLRDAMTENQSLENQLGFKQGVIDGQNILIREHEKRYDEQKTRLSKVQSIATELLSWHGALCNSAKVGHRLEGALGVGDASQNCTKGEDNQK